VKGKVLLDGTDDPLMGVTVFYSDQAPVFLQRKGKLGTLTTITSGDEVTTDAGLEINGGSVLETVYGTLTHAGVIAATDPIIGWGRIKSSDLLPPFDVQFGIAGAHGLLSTSGAPQGAPIEEQDIELAMAASVALAVSIKAVSTATNDYSGVVGMTYT
jgi:preprotein translocase subunit YajC